MNGPPLQIGVTLLFTQDAVPSPAQEAILRLFPDGIGTIEDALLKFSRESKELQPLLIERLFNARADLSVEKLIEDEQFITNGNLHEVIGNLKMSDIVSISMNGGYNRRSAAPMICDEPNCNFHCNNYNGIIDHYEAAHGKEAPLTVFETPELAFEHIT